MIEKPSSNICPFSEWYELAAEIKDRFDEKNRYLPRLDNEGFFYIPFCNNSFPEWFQNQLLKAGYKLKFETEDEYRKRSKENIERYKLLQRKLASGEWKAADKSKKK